MYTYKKSTPLSYSDAVAKVRDELKKEGFGVLTEIDVKQTLKSKLDVDFEDYIILGACNPPLAYQALTAERDIGVLLPCNIIVYVQGGKTYVSAVLPAVQLGKCNSLNNVKNCQFFSEKRFLNIHNFSVHSCSSHLRQFDLNFTSGVNRIN